MHMSYISFGLFFLGLLAGGLTASIVPNSPVGLIIALGCYTLAICNELGRIFKKDK